MRTLQHLVDAGHDLRTWCYACQTTHIIDSSMMLAQLLDRGEPVDMGWAKERLLCEKCRSNADLLLVPARRPPPKVRSWEDEVVAFFFSSRARQKGRRQGR